MIEGFHSYDSIASDYYVDLNNTTYDESTVVLRFDNGGSLTLHLEGELNRHDETQTPIIYTADGEPINLFSGTIYGNDYEDYITNDKDNVTIETYGGDDDIDNYGSEVLINAGNGDDNISAHGSEILIDAGDGNDFIQLEGSFESTISGGAGNDTITGNSYHSYIDGGEGDDLIQLNGEEYSDNIIFAGKGNDTIISNADRVYINGNDGNDFIQINGGRNNTVSGGAGNDLIAFNDADNSTYVYTGGNDTVTGFKASDVLNLNGNEIFAQSYDNGTVYLETSGGNLTIQLSGALDVNSEGSLYLLHTTDEDISFVVNPREGTANADTISNSYSGITVNALAGNDRITNSGDNVTINAGAGNDTITNSGSAVLYQYASGDGNDVINGFTENDTLEITSGNISSASLSGSDAILSVGTGKITVKDAKEKELNLLIGSEVITTVISTISGETGNDNLVSTGKNNTLVGGAGDDTITVSDKANLIQYATGQGKDVIVGLGETDSIEITSGAVKNSVQSGSDVLVTINSGTSNVITIKNRELKTLLVDDNFIVYNDSQYPISLTSGADNKSFTDKNATVYGVGGNDTIYNSGDNSYIDGGAGNDRLFNTGGNDTVYGLESDDTIQISDSYSTLKSGSNVIIQVGSNKISLNGATVYGVGGNDTISNDGANSYIDGGAGNDRLTNTGSNSTIAGGTGADTIYTSGEGSVIEYGSGDGKDVIVGFGGSDSIQITSGSVTKATQSGANVLVTVGSGTSNVITIKNFQLNHLLIDGGLLTYSEEILPTEGNDTLTYEDSGIIVNALGGNDIISLSSSASGNTLNGGTGNTITVKDKEIKELIDRNGVIIENPYPISLKGAADTETFSDEGATVYALGGNDVIENTGANSYIDGGGKDNITGFSDKDSIVVDGTISKSVQSGTNVLVTVGTGTSNVITIKDSSIETLGVIENVITYVEPDVRGPFTLTSGADSKIYEIDGISVDASGGKDVIYGFGESDSVIVDGTITKVLNNGNDVHVTVGTSANVITIKDMSRYDLSFDNGVIAYNSEPDTDVYLTSTADKESFQRDNIVIYAQAGNDSVVSSGEGVTLEGEAGNDALISSGINGSLSGGAGNDKISIGAGSTDITIGGGAGADTIYLNENGNVYQYAGGKDVIYGFTTGVDSLGNVNGTGADTIEIASGEVSRSLQSGNDVLVTVGSSANVLTIKNVLIEQLVAGEGVIIADDIPTLISGTRAANRMEYDLNHATLQALGGNDTVINSGNVIEYAQGDGKDVIFGFGGNDSVQITEGEISKYNQSGSNVLVTVGSSASVITLRNVQLSELAFEDNMIIAAQADGLFADDNFIGGTTIDDVSEITATNYSVGKLETGTVELEQDTLSAAFAYSQEK